MLRTYSSSPTHAVVDVGALAHNLGQLRARLAPTCAVIGIAKANAYGHGAVDICKALLQCGVSAFGVATIGEGVELREAGVACDILVLGPTVPREANELVRHRLTPLIYDESMVLALTERLHDSAGPCSVHVEVETGMGRLGIAPERVMSLLQSPAFKGRLALAGLMTHFADADSTDPTFTHEQIGRFTHLLDQVRAAGVTVPLAHMANSAGLLHYPQSHGDAVRPGLSLYGYLTRNHDSAPLSLKPVLSWLTHIVQIRTIQPGTTVSYNRTFTATRQSRIAILPVGYADGYSRLHSNRSSVLVHGTRAPVVGRVCMDMIMVDVTDVPQARPGDEVALIGAQGTERITAHDLAGWQGSIAYEVLCDIGPRVRRLYVGGATTS